MPFSAKLKVRLMAMTGHRTRQPLLIPTERKNGNSPFSRSSPHLTESFNPAKISERIIKSNLIAMLCSWCMGWVKMQKLGSRATSLARRSLSNWSMRATRSTWATIGALNLARTCSWRIVQVRSTGTSISERWVPRTCQLSFTASISWRIEAWLT